MPTSVIIPSPTLPDPPSNVLPYGYINGLKLTYTAADQVTVSIGKYRSDDDTVDILYKFVLLV